MQREKEEEEPRTGRRMDRKRSEEGRRTGRRMNRKRSEQGPRTGRRMDRKRSGTCAVDFYGKGYRQEYKDAVEQAEKERDMGHEGIGTDRKR
jgi:hypothetical protein